MRQSSTHRIRTPTRVAQRHHSQPAPSTRIHATNRNNRIERPHALPTNANPLQQPIRINVEGIDRIRAEQQRQQERRRLLQQQLRAANLAIHRQEMFGGGLLQIAGAKYNLAGFATSNAEDTYEARLRLDENIAKKGVGPEGLKRLHMHEFDSHNFENHSCPVCLDAYSESQFVANMPTCRHQFHIECIERWLQSSTKCPVCRTSMVK
jgi:hypothetical protein